MISLSLFTSVAHSLSSNAGYSSTLNQVAASAASTQTQQPDSPEEQEEQAISQEQEQRDFQAKLNAVAAEMNRRLNGNGFTYRSGVALGKLIGTRSDEDESDEKATKTYRRVRQAVLETNEKRSIEQFNLVVGPKIYLINSSEPKWDRFSLCGTGDRGYIAGATNTSQEVLIFDIRNYMLQTLGAASANLSAQLPPRRGQNNIATSCKYKSLTVITEDPAQGIYHTAIADAALSVAQYMAASYSVVNATFPGRA